jgi:hypothetical protein
MQSHAAKFDPCGVDASGNVGELGIGLGIANLTTADAEQTE